MSRAFRALSVLVLGAALTGAIDQAAPFHSGGMTPREGDLFYRRRGGDDRSLDDRDPGTTRGDSVRGGGGSGSSSGRSDDRASSRPADKPHGSDARPRDDDSTRIGR